MKSFAAVAVAATFAGAVSAHPPPATYTKPAACQPPKYSPAPVYKDPNAGRACQNITVPVTITARNGVFDVEALTTRNNIDVTNFILSNSRQGSNFTDDQLLGYTDFCGTYDLATTYCAPISGAPNVVQLLTHGIGFDRSYWDVPFNGFNYSYVNQAIAKGYATFSHDRLGVGESPMGEPVNEIQAALQIAALKALTDKLRAGEIPGVPAFERVIHHGHSFGAVQSYALSAMYPDITDGLVLQGWAQNGTFLPFFQLGGGFTQANLNEDLSDFPDGYFAPATESAVQTNFFAEGVFDPEILTFGAENGQPVTIGELLTIGGATGSVNPTTAPVLAIIGEKDLPFCGGDCLAPPDGFDSIPAAAVEDFPNTTAFQATVIPAAGHALNLEYTFVETYAATFAFLEASGLAP